MSVTEIERLAGIFAEMDARLDKARRQCPNEVVEAIMLPDRHHGFMKRMALRAGLPMEFRKLPVRRAYKTRNICIQFRGGAVSGSVSSTRVLPHTAL